jgi:catechol 2,3-dioxygenase-like lactoylglutathione lyase family enzyme
MIDFSLDHVGFMVRNLDAAAARWERLGFLLSRRSRQMGKIPGKSDMAPWASSNQCVMFERGYLELIGITNPEEFNPWSRFLNRFEGPHITALRCENGEKAYEALSRRIEHFDPPLQRLRKAPFGEGEREFRFRNIFSQDDHFPEGRYIIIEHQTPEVIWQDELMIQPNGAVELAELVFCADVHEGLLDRLSCISGEEALETEAGGFIELSGGGSLSVLSEEAFRSRYEGAPAPIRPAVAATVIRVKNMGVLESLLIANGVKPVFRSPLSLWLSPEDGNGAVIEFIEG